MQVVKRDGRVMEFNKDRIVNAIVKAMKQTPDGVDEDLANKIACSIEKQLENVDEVSVYEIQDLVEKKLMVSSRKEVATAYITYRYTRDVARRSKTKNVFLDILTSKSHPHAEKEDSYQNISDMMHNFAAEAIKPYVDMILLSKDVREAERLGYIDIEYKSYYATKAIKSFHLLLKSNTDILKQCHDIEGATIQIVSLINKLTEEVIEGITIHSIDSALAPYVRKTYEDEWKKILEDEGKTKSKEEEERLKALAQKRMQKRVHRAIYFMMNSFSSLYTHCKVSAMSFDGEESKEDDLIRQELLAFHSISCVEEATNTMEELCGVVSCIALNLSTIATECDLTASLNGTKEDIFLNAMKPFVNIAVKSLVERFRFQATATKSQFPVLMSGLWPESEKLEASDTIENVLRKGKFELKLDGMEETVLQLCDTRDTSTIQKIMDKITKEINEDLEKYAEEYHLKFVLK